MRVGVPVRHAVCHIQGKKAVVQQRAKALAVGQRAGMLQQRRLQVLFAEDTAMEGGVIGELTGPAGRACISSAAFEALLNRCNTPLLPLELSFVQLCNSSHM